MIPSYLKKCHSKTTADMAAIQLFGIAIVGASIKAVPVPDEECSKWRSTRAGPSSREPRKGARQQGLQKTRGEIFHPVALTGEPLTLSQQNLWLFEHFELEFLSARLTWQLTISHWCFPRASQPKIWRFSSQMEFSEQLGMGKSKLSGRVSDSGNIRFNSGLLWYGTWQLCHLDKCRPSKGEFWRRTSKKSRNIWLPWQVEKCSKKQFRRVYTHQVIMINDT